MAWLLRWYVRCQETLASLQERRAPLGDAERGAGIMEYCLILGVVAAVIVTVLTQFMGAISGVFTRLIGVLNGVG